MARYILNPTIKDRIMSNKDEPDTPQSPGVNPKELIIPNPHGAPSAIVPPKDENDRSELYYENTWDEILTRLSGGETLTSICRETNMPKKSKLMKWIFDDPDREKDYKFARSLMLENRFDSHMDELDSKVDEDGDPIDPLLVREKFNVTKFLASKWSKETYGDDKQNASININMGEMTLDALRKRNVDAIDVTPDADQLQPLEHKNG